MANKKQHLVQIIAISISLFYMLHPLQNQIKYCLHTISHIIEAQSKVAPHTHSHNSTTAHSHSHTINHEHQFIAFFNKLFGSPENDSTNSLVQKIKIDKHIVDKQTYNIKNYTILTIGCIYTSPHKTVKGYITTVKKPPKSILA